MADEPNAPTEDGLPLSPEEAEHKKLFEEFAAKHREGGAAAAAAPTTEESREEDDSAGSEPQAEPSTEPETTAKETPAVEDIWTNATPAQLAARDAMAARLADADQYRRSNDGRIAGFQAQVDDLKRAIAGRAEATTVAAATAADTKVDDATKSLNEILSDPDFVKAEKEYPEIYGPIRKTMGAVLAKAANSDTKVTALETELGTLRTTTTTKFERDNLREQTLEITQLDPDYVEVVSKPEFRPAFDAWLETQPQAVKDLVFASAAGGVQNAKDASWAFRAFKRDTGFGGGQSGAAKADTKTSTSSATDRTRRSLQLETSTSVSSRRPSAIVDDKGGTAAQSSGEAAYDADWKRNVERIRKRQQAEGINY